MNMIKFILMDGNDDKLKDLLEQPIKDIYNLDSFFVEDKFNLSNSTYLDTDAIFEHLELNYHNPNLNLNEICYLIANKKVVSCVDDYRGQFCEFMPGGMILEEKSGYTSTKYLKNMRNEDILKVTLHQVGHLLGLEHCDNKIKVEGLSCVMNDIGKDKTFDKYFGDISSSLCTKCHYEVKAKNSFIANVVNKIIYK